MFVISNELMARFEADRLLRRRARFIDWVELYRQLIRIASPEDAARAYDTALPEAERAGVETDERLFLYAAARGLMPRMTGRQYLLTLDIVFAPTDEPRQLRALAALSKQTDE